MQSLFIFIQLPTIEKKLFFLSLYVLYVYRIRLKSCSFQQLLTLVQQKTSGQWQKPFQVKGNRVARIVQRASKLVPAATCLSNALAGKIIFHRCGYTTKLHIGVANDENNKFGAHAWLTLDGLIVLGEVPNIEKFTELDLADAREKF